MTPTIRPADLEGFAGFEDRRGRAGPAMTRYRIGGAGPPLLLLHGYPQTHVTWHRVAALLESDHRLVVPDLPGYGDSKLIGADAPDTATFSKRAMAASMIELMDGLGHARFAVAGHDRGARVAYRMALDHPDAITNLVVIDVIPTIDEWATFDRAESLDTFHWPFLAQPDGLPERLIAGDPDFFVDQLMRRWAGDVTRLDPAALAEYRRCFRSPPVVAASCADYRAGATIDVDHDEDDRRRGRRIACPVLVLASRGRGDLTPAWHDWARQVTGAVLPGGHFLQEECPVETASAIGSFLAASPG